MWYLLVILYVGSGMLMTEMYILEVQDGHLRQDGETGAEALARVSLMVVGWPYYFVLPGVKQVAEWLQEER